MSRQHVPRCKPRKNKEIEHVAHLLLSDYYPERLEEPGPVPVHHFIEFVIPKITGIVFGVAELPTPMEGTLLPGTQRSPGHLLLSPRVYDRLLDGFPRERFTAAHEGGHAILHAAEIRAQLIEGGLSLNRRSEIPAYLDPEHQANVFAAALLMNENAMHVAFQRFGDNFQTLARVFGVSQEAIGNRLDRLGLVPK